MHRLCDSADVVFFGLLSFYDSAELQKPLVGFLQTLVVWFSVCPLFLNIIIV